MPGIQQYFLNQLSFRNFRISKKVPHPHGCRMINNMSVTLPGNAPRSGTKCSPVLRIVKGTKGAAAVVTAHFFCYRGCTVATCHVRGAKRSRSCRHPSGKHHCRSSRRGHAAPVALAATINNPFAAPKAIVEMEVPATGSDRVRHQITLEKVPSLRLHGIDNSRSRGGKLCNEPHAHS